ncbi:MAG: AEC family transporter [Desulfobacteraceae bacterium]|nr:AEC family transporter [Desulfobacteraceae bacterium]MCF8093916.1 AEC family transporter [Desulfobacteraceae bacterium]
MADILIQTFTSTLLSMLKIFLIIPAAGILIRKNVLSRNNLHALSVATVDVFLPCLSFTSILKNFRPGEFDIWWVLPTAGILITLTGMLLGWLAFFRELPEKRNMIPMTGVQNAGFLILPLGAVLFPDQFELFSVYVFMFVIGQSLPIWSLAKQMTTAEPGTRLQCKDMLTPPLVATLLAIALVFAGLHPFFFAPQGPQSSGIINTALATVFEAVQLLGQATVPLAIFILGGVLGSISFKLRPYLWDAIRVLSIKFILLPVLTILIVYFSGLRESIPLLAVFFVIQSSSAPAIALVLQVKKYGGNEQKIGSVLLLSYIACLLMMPLWVAVWNLISHF